MKNLKEKVILVTGASQGLGEAISQTLVKAGAIVVGADIQKEKILQMENGYFLDVKNENNISELIGKIEKRYKRLDAIINNAGIDFTKPFNEITTEEWDSVLAVNLRGPFLLSKYAFPLMKKQGEGHIINITSTAGKRAWANASSYHASKWGL